MTANSKQIFFHELLRINPTNVIASVHPAWSSSLRAVGIQYDEAPVVNRKYDLAIIAQGNADMVSDDHFSLFAQTETPLLVVFDETSDNQFVERNISIVAKAARHSYRRDTSYIYKADDLIALRFEKDHRPLVEWIGEYEWQLAQSGFEIATYRQLTLEYSQVAVDRERLVDQIYQSDHADKHRLAEAALHAEVLRRVFDVVAQIAPPGTRRLQTLSWVSNKIAKPTLKRIINRTTNILQTK